MNELQTFKWQGTKEIRTVQRGADALFVAKDICDVLEIGNPSQALSRLDDDEKDDIILNDTVGKRQGYSVVTESGMYSLVMTSRKPEAKAFKKWVTSEVIPSIRKTGTYSVTRLSQAELIVKMAEENLSHETKLNIHDNRISALERKIGSVPQSAVITIEPAVGLKEIAHDVLPVVEVKSVKEVKTKKAVVESEFISVKAFNRTVGLDFKDGKPQGIGRSMTKACKNAGIEPIKVPSGPNAKVAFVKTYPPFIFREVYKEKGLI